MSARSKSFDESIVQADDGSVVLYDYQPGNMTRYSIALVYPEYGDYAGQTGFLGKDEILVVSGNKAFIVSKAMYLHYSYVMEKTGLGEADAVVIAEFVAYKVPGITAMSSEEWERSHG